MKGREDKTVKRLLKLVEQWPQEDAEMRETMALFEQLVDLRDLLFKCGADWTELAVEKYRWAEAEHNLWVARYTSKGNAVSRSGPICKSPLAALRGLADQAIT